jgi:hypothetical protein
MSFTYILDGHNPVPCDNTFKWGKWMSSTDRHVADTIIGKIRISTVFLGVDHNFSLIGSPLLFETMIFGGELDQEMRRYETWEEAEKGHKRFIKKVESAIAKAKG